MVLPTEILRPDQLKWLSIRQIVPVHPAKDSAQIKFQVSRPADRQAKVSSWLLLGMARGARVREMPE